MASTRRSRIRDEFLSHAKPPELASPSTASTASSSMQSSCLLFSPASPFEAEEQQQRYPMAPPASPFQAPELQQKSAPVTLPWDTGREPPANWRSKVAAWTPIKGVFPSGSSVKTKECSELGMRRKSSWKLFLECVLPRDDLPGRAIMKNVM